MSEPSTFIQPMKKISLGFWFRLVYVVIDVVYSIGQFSSLVGFTFLSSSAPLNNHSGSSLVSLSIFSIIFYALVLLGQGFTLYGYWYNRSWTRWLLWIWMLFGLYAVVGMIIFFAEGMGTMSVWGVIRILASFLAILTALLFFPKKPAVTLPSATLDVSKK